MAFSGSPNAVARHKWYMLDYSTATCKISDQTPQEFQSLINGFGGRANGYTAEEIAPSDVFKFSLPGSGPRGGSDEDIKVEIRGTLNGAPVKWRFFSQKETCSIWAKDVQPQQAPESDIN
jgi:hypothetical protein